MKKKEGYEMNKQEIALLFNRIKNHYNTFTTSDEKIQEWYRFLKDYHNEDVNRRLDEYLKCEYDQPPLCMSLTRGIEKIKRDTNNSWTTCCDICKEHITIYDNDMTDFDKHYRKCQKIDFIDRQSKAILGEVIDKEEYYAMPDKELDEQYQRVMESYRKIKRGNILKRIPDEE